MNSKLSTQDNRHLRWLIFVWLAFSLGSLSLAPLFDYDETIYAQTALDMMRNGEWIVPIANGMQFFEKPPFTYYMMDISFMIFGENAFAARLPSLLFSLATAWILFRFGMRIHSRNFGLAAATIFLTMLEVGLLAHAAILDAVLNFFVASTLLNYFLWIEKGDRKYALWTAAMMGAGVSIKGPVGVVVPLLIIFFDRLRVSDLGGLLRRIPWLPTLTLFFAAALPWYVMILIQHGPQFLYEFIWVHNIGRALNPMQGHGGSWHYYLVVFMVSVLPWLGWWIWSAKKSWQNRNDNEPLAAIAMLGLIWIFVVMVLFTIARTKLPHYISAIYPGVALMLTTVLFRFTPDASVLRRIRIGTALLLLPLAAALIAFPFIYPELGQFIKHPRAVAVFQQDITPSGWLTLGGFALLAAVALTFRGRNTGRQLIHFAVAGLVLQASLFLGLATYAGKLVQAPQIRIAEALKTLPPEMPVYSFQLNMPSISFYSGRNYEILIGADATGKLAAIEGAHAIILRSESKDQFGLAEGAVPAVDQGGYLLYIIPPVSKRTP